MSRSVKKTPVHANAPVPSEKADKQLWHQRLRSREKQRLGTAGDLDGFVPLHEYEVSDTRDMAKDGKHYVTPAEQLQEAKRKASRHDDAKGVERQLHKLRAK